MILVPAAPRSVDVVPSDEKLTVRWQEPAEAGDADFEDTDPRAAISGDDLSVPIAAILR